MKTRYIFSLLLLLLGRPLGGWAQTLTTYQAEAAQPVAATIGTGAAGYTGSGFVEYITQQGSSSLTYEPVFISTCLFPKPGQRRFSGHGHRYRPAW